MSKYNHRQEPLIRIAKRSSIDRKLSWCIRGASVLVALLLSGLFIFSVTGLNPIKVYGAMIDGALGSSRKAWFTIRDTMMMLCIGIGLAPAFKMRFWNIGAEGQILMGGCATAGLMIAMGKAVPRTDFRPSPSPGSMISVFEPLPKRI